jgi:hypothetical protein
MFEGVPRWLSSVHSPPSLVLDNLSRASIHILGFFETKHLHPLPFSESLEKAVLFALSSKPLALSSCRRSRHLRKSHQEASGARACKLSMTPVSLFRCNETHHGA